MMTEKFNAALLLFFDCHEGAYSVITPNEFKKSQVTFVGPEQDLVEDYFGEILKDHHGSISAMESKGIDPELEFRLHPTGERKKLTVSYKTNKPRELRFYARVENFKPKAGEYWCVFRRGDEIWLGAFSQWMLDAVMAGRLISQSRSELLENDVDSYQDELNATVPEKVPSAALKWKRNPKVAAEAIKRVGAICEIHPEFPTFVSRATDRNFVEAHHLVPMKMQSEFGNQPLDAVDNVCILNPLAHRMLHHAHFHIIKNDIAKLLKNRQTLLERLKIHEHDVMEMYR